MKQNRWNVLAAIPFAIVLASVATAAEKKDEIQERNVDVCVVGATPSGILAAVAVRQGGRSVVIVEPSRWVGGMLGAGLKPTQDCPNIHATGGLTKQLLTTLGQPWMEEDGRKVRASKSNRELNPADIRQDFLELLQEHDVPVIYQHRINRCEIDGTTIQAVVFDYAPFDSWGCPVAEPERVESLRVTARVFIDASYEGDLMAGAGVSYRVGREAASEYDEPYAGVQTPMEAAPIDPFVEPGNPASGLLAWVEDDHEKPLGAADGYIQAYNYRYYTTSNPKYRIPLTPPPDYDAKEFELVGRYVDHLCQTIDDPQTLNARLQRIFPGWMNSGEWNYHRDSLFTMAPVGISQEYAAGDFAAKAQVWKRHQDYLRGLHHFMSTDSRVPEAFRRQTAALGLDGRPHPETHGWPHQLYIRVARRLNGRYTVTAHDVYNRTTVDDPIGLAQYGIDTYPARRIRFRDEGKIHVGIEGKMFIGGSRGPTNVPYPIPYRAITPQAEECGNLLVPVCFSASHLGYASARMEPVFMICGHSAGIAACLAMEADVTVQQVDQAALRQALEQAGQVLEWTDELAELARSTGGTRYTFGELLRTCDTDGDGLVSQSEWEAGKPGWGWLFPIIDTDKNGFIDAKEYAAFQEYKRINPNWRQLRPNASDR